MIRGKRLFICPKCGKIFRALDIEYGATAASHPMHCPRCGSLSPALDLSSYLVYRRLFRDMHDGEGK